jgi:hypothetical protein
VAAAASHASVDQRVEDRALVLAERVITGTLTVVKCSRCSPMDAPHDTVRP